MNKLIVYTNDGCRPCTAAKDNLKRKGIAFEERNIAHDDKARQILKDAGFMQTPIFGWAGKLHTLAELPRISREALAQQGAPA